MQTVETLYIAISIEFQLLYVCFYRFVDDMALTNREFSLF